MYKVYVEDIYQIEDILSFCAYHNFRFDYTEEGMFLRTFPTKEEADKFVKESILFTPSEDPEWVAFIVHTDDKGKVIDINGKHFPSELKHYLVETSDGSFFAYDTKEEFEQLDNVIGYFDYEEYLNAEELSKTLLSYEGNKLGRKEQHVF